MCGCRLEKGWHADHIVPYSRGGKTHIDNAQALCPTCNLTKGDFMHTSDPYKSHIFGPPPFANPHKWQRRAVDRFFATDERFLADATPGCGKTAFAAYLFRHGYGDEWDQVIVVTNSRERRRGWTEDFHEFGIDLMQNWAGRDRGPTVKDYHGCVITYNILPGNEHQLRALCHKPTLVIFDEIHHLGDSLRWGHAATEAFDRKTVQTIGLTGTPFRSDDNLIPFIKYDVDNAGAFRTKGHVGYTYGDALRDGVLRYINFKTYDGEMEWQGNDGEHYNASFTDDINVNQYSARLRTALVSKDWIIPALEKADAKLSAIRKHTPNAGGLIVAMDQPHALRIQQWMMSDECGISEAPAIVISDKQDASEVLNDYRNSSKRWIIAVRMISEGINIKRLRLGFYASNVVAPLFLQQVIGRVLRGPDGEAWFWFPADPRITPVLEEIKEMRDHVIDNREPEGDGPPPDVDDLPSLFTPISAKIGKSEVLGPYFEEIPQMTEEERSQLPPEVLSAYITSLIGAAEAVPDSNSKTKEQRAEELRTELQSLAATVARRKWPDLFFDNSGGRNEAMGKAHGKSNKIAGIVSTDKATFAELKRKKKVLLDMMGGNNGR